jgi:hypothetical protein
MIENIYKTYIDELIEDKTDIAEVIACIELHGTEHTDDLKIGTYFYISGTKHILKSLFGKRKVTPSTFTVENVRAEIQLAYIQKEQWVDAAVAIDSTDSERTEIINTLNTIADAILGYIFQPMDPIFPEFIEETADCYVYSSIDIDYMVLDKLEDPVHTRRILTDLYTVYLRFKTLDVKPGADLRDYAYDVTGNLRFFDIGNIVYNMTGEYVPCSDSDITINFETPSKSTQLFVAIIEDIILTY